VKGRYRADHNPRACADEVRADGESGHPNRGYLGKTSGEDRTTPGVRWHAKSEHNADVPGRSARGLIGNFTACSAKSTRISRQLLGRCHGPELTLDNVARDRENVESAGSKHPACDPFDLVDDDLTRWCIVAAILLDGPDPLAGPNLEREGQRAATTRGANTRGGGEESKSSSPQDSATVTSDY
jgi:hypothetical protein